jgi:SP family general alpha glucoside:H+ symporter-like MFS transporter
MESLEGPDRHVFHVDHNDNVLRVEDSKIRRMSVANPEFAHLSHEAKGAAHTEKHMTFAQAIKLYPKACGWSILLSTAIVMEGYDTALLGNFYAFPPFQERYGELVPGSDPPSYQVSASK